MPTKQGDIQRPDTNTIADVLTGCVFQSPSQWVGTAELLETVDEQTFTALQRRPGFFYYAGTKTRPAGYYVPQSVLDTGKYPGRLLGYSPEPQTETPFGGRILREHQARTVTFLRLVTPQREGAIVGADMGLGKALRLSDVIPTPTGYKKVRDIAIGDLVFGATGTPTKVVGLTPIEKRKVYRCTFSDGAVVHCCDDHLWDVQTPVQKQRKNGFQTKPLHSFRNDLHDKAGNRKHYVPISEPVQYQSGELLIHPYVFGALLGDGCLTKNSVTLCNPELDVVRKVTDLLPPDVTVKDRSQKRPGIQWAIRVNKGQKNSVLDALRTLGLAGCVAVNKYIPSVFKLASVSDRLHLLQGLMDTDGDISASGTTTTFNTSSRQLMLDFIEIVRSLGGIAKPIQTKAHPKYMYKGVMKTGQPAYRCTFTLPFGMCPISSEKHLSRYKARTKYEVTRGFEKVEEAGVDAVRCLMVEADDGRFLANDYVVTHNCSMVLQSLWLDGLLSKPGVICGPLAAAAAWCGPTSDATRFYGMDVFRVSGRKDIDPSVLIQHPHIYVNYDILDAWSTWITSSLAPAWIVFDEIHLLMHPTSSRSNAAAALSRWHTIEKRIGLSGTPIPKYRMDLWNPLRCVQPRQWGDNKHEFGVYFCGGHREMASGRDDEERSFFVYNDETNSHELRQRLAGTLLWYTRDEVAGVLPDLTRTVRHISAEKDELLEYHEASINIIKYLKKEANAAVTANKKNESFDLKSWVSSEVGNLAQLLGSDFDVSKVVNRKNGKNAIRLRALSTLIGLLSKFKAERAVQEIQHCLANHNHVVVFTWRKDSAALICDALNSLIDDKLTNCAKVGEDFPERLPVVFGPIDGSITQPKRQAAAQEFARKPCGVYVATMGAAGIAINELSVASCALFVDLHWNPSTLTQAESRVHRDGSPHDAVDIVYLVARDTVDELFIDHLTKKACAAKAVKQGDLVDSRLVADLSSISQPTTEDSLDRICALLSNEDELL